MTFVRSVIASFYCCESTTMMRHSQPKDRPTSDDLLGIQRTRGVGIQLTYDRIFSCESDGTGRTQYDSRPWDILIGRKISQGKAMVTCAILACKNCTCNHSFTADMTRYHLIADVRFSATVGDGRLHGNMNNQLCQENHTHTKWQKCPSTTKPRHAREHDDLSVSLFPYLYYRT